MVVMDSTAGTAPALTDESGGSRGTSLVSASGVFKIYKEGLTETVALQGASLELSRGEFATLVGPSGSGKSTLLWILAGLTLPSAGRVMVDGQDITVLDESARAMIRSAKVGIVFQKGNLVPFLSAEENVLLALNLAGTRTKPRHRAREVLGDLGLVDRLHHYPRQMSGGEAQRVGIAVALANDPSLLLGDEVTGELDSETSAQVMDMLVSLQKERGLTMLIVTHNPSLAASSGRRLAIIDGLVVES
jgi:putative ABC transport system ATP-binding protein